MERFGPPTSRDLGPVPIGGTSSAGNEELHPERSYGTDLRYLDSEERQTAGRADTSNDVQQNRVRHFLASAKAAGKYRQNSLISEPSLDGTTPRSAATIKGTTLPNLGTRFGRGGGTNYARKPGASSGTFVGF